MSDIAPFVAVSIRDKVVLELQEEIKNLQRKFDDFVANQRTIAIKEVTNEKEAIVYATAKVDRNGQSADFDEIPRWHVELTKQFDFPLEKLNQLELSIGDKSKKLMDPSADRDQLVSFMAGYERETKRGDILLVVAPEQTIVHGSVGPISQRAHNVLSREPKEYAMSDFGDIVAVATAGEAGPVTLEFDSVTFNNFAHTLWYIQD